MNSIHFGASVVFGLLLIAIRRPFARWVSPGEAQVSIQTQSLIEAGTAIMAAYFVLNGVTILSTYLVRTNTDFPTSDDYLYWQGVFSIAFGVLMFVLSIGVGRLWQVLRSQGEPRA